MYSRINTHFTKFISNFPKRPIILSSDLILTLFVICYLLTLNATFDLQSNQSNLFLMLALILVSQALTYWMFGLYRGIWRFASLPDLVRIAKACVTGTLLLFIVCFYFEINYLIPYSLMPLFCVLTIGALGGSRLTYRWLKDNRKFYSSGIRVLVIGAGSAGESILRELKRKTYKDYLPIGLIDDDPSKFGLEIHGIRVIGNTNQLVDITRQKNVELILIAIPTANSVQMRRVVNLCEKTGIQYRTLPNFNDIATGKASMLNMRQVSVEDLLCRDPIQFNRNKLMATMSQKSILVTGAGGSIGSEVCRKIAECQPKAMILIEHCEYNLFQIQTDLQKHYPRMKLHLHLVSICNKEAIEYIMKLYKPDYVFHAAAYKHVPLLEPQARIAIENNIFGTQIVAKAAADNNVKKFILVSTDKAVNPANVMGATKRCAEIICQCFNKLSATNFIIVRFGNVLGSTGSVVPIFKQQISNGGPLTVTHPDMERYFMTIQEAAQLIIQTVTIEKPSDLYVLDMGEPIKIQYLAEQMIKLSGQRPNIDIKVTYTGLRPGEKIHEKLFYENEVVAQSEHEKIMRVIVPEVKPHQFHLLMKQLKKLYQSHDSNLKEFLFSMINSDKIDELLSEDTAILNSEHTKMPLAVEFLN